MKCCCKCLGSVFCQIFPGYFIVKSKWKVFYNFKRLSITDKYIFYSLICITSIMNQKFGNNDSPGDAGSMKMYFVARGSVVIFERTYFSLFHWILKFYIFSYFWFSKSIYFIRSQYKILFSLTASNFCLPRYKLCVIWHYQFTQFIL